MPYDTAATPKTDFFQLFLIVFTNVVIRAIVSYVYTDILRLCVHVLLTFILVFHSNVSNARTHERMHSCVSVVELSHLFSFRIFIYNQKFRYDIEEFKNYARF